MRNKRIRISKKNASDIGTLLDSVFNKNKWRQRINLNSVFQYWEDTVGPEISEHAQPSYIRGRVLWVDVTDSIWMQQLHLQKILLLEKLNQKIQGEDQLDDIRFQIGTPLQQPTPIRPLTPSIKTPDKKKIKEFENLITTVKDDDVKKSLYRMWAKFNSML